MNNPLPALQLQPVYNQLSESTYDVCLLSNQPHSFGNTEPVSISLRLSFNQKTESLPSFT